MISESSSLASSTPATSEKETFTDSSAWIFALLFPTDMRPPPSPPPIERRSMNIQNAMMSTKGSTHLRRRVSHVSSMTPVNSMSSPTKRSASSGSTRTVRNCAGASVSGAVSVPLIWPLLICRSVTPPSFCSARNSL